MSRAEKAGRCHDDRDTKHLVARRLFEGKYKGSCLSLLQVFLYEEWGYRIDLESLLLRNPTIEDCHESVLFEMGFKQVEEPVWPTIHRLQVVVFRDRASGVPAAVGVWLDSHTVLTYIDSVRILTRADMARTNRRSYEVDVTHLFYHYHRTHQEWPEGSSSRYES